MISWYLCINCRPFGIIKTRKKRTNSNRNPQCNRCYSTRLIGLTDNQLVEFLNKGKLPAWVFKLNRYKNILKQPTKRAAVKPQAPVEKPTAVEEDKERPPGCKRSIGEYDPLDPACKYCDNQYSLPCIEKKRKIKFGGKIK